MSDATERLPEGGETDEQRAVREAAEQAEQEAQARAAEAERLRAQAAAGTPAEDNGPDLSDVAEARGAAREARTIRKG